MPGAQVTNEDTALVFSTGNGNLISVSDTDVDEGTGELEITLTATNGVLTLSGLAGLTFSVGDGVADATMTFTGSTANINTALDGLTYDPTPAYNGAASLTILTDDQGNTGAGGALTDNDAITITVNAVNNAPINTIPVAQFTNEDTAIVFSTGNGNLISVSDIDVDEGTGELEITLTVTNGVLTLSGTTGLTFSVGDGVADSTMTFTGSTADINTALDGMSFDPAFNYNGPGASIQIITNDQGNTGAGGALTDTDVISITVNAVNDAPVLNPIGNIVMDEETTLAFTATAIDPDSTLTFGLGPGAPAGASISAGGVFSWTPTEAQGPGVYPVTINVTDGEFNSTETIDITVNEVNVGPVASNDAITILEDAAATTIDVLANDEDHDNNTIITIIAVTNGTHGTVTITNGGVDLTYEPDADFFGTDTFTYNITDGEFTDTATVTITVTNVNDDPIAVDDAASVDEDSSTTISVLINDGFAPDEGETLTIDSVTQGSHGTVTIASGDLRVIYQPDANFVGTDTFTYTISDGKGGTATATVTMTVNNVNDNPIITTAGIANATDGDTYTVDFDASDIDGDAIEWSFTGADWLTISSEGVLNGSAITGTYTIRVTASDGNGGSDTHTYTLTVEELDSDGDGVPDDIDAFPNDANETVDTDEDGIGNNADPDDDNDGVLDDDDDFPLNPTGATDTDGDGKPDVILEAPDWTGTALTEDTDDDGDGVLDVDDPEPTNSSITGNEYDTGWPYWYVLGVIGIAALIALICLGAIWLIRKYVIE